MAGGRRRRATRQRRRRSSWKWQRCWALGGLTRRRKQRIAAADRRRRALHEQHRVASAKQTLRLGNGGQRQSKRYGVEE